MRGRGERERREREEKERGERERWGGKGNPEGVKWVDERGRTLKYYYHRLTWIASKLKTLVHYADLVGLAAAHTKLWTRPG